MPTSKKVLSLKIPSAGFLAFSNPSAGFLVPPVPCARVLSVRRAQVGVFGGGCKLECQVQNHTLRLSGSGKHFISRESLTFQDDRSKLLRRTNMIQNMITF